mmetsp:Transcript_136068/g.344528  ORF Transcript_136068/g.344528 Transcript_136068/m.344528 type:complete len:111 (-) Transcript_136068:1920-2252(-)
MSGTSFGHLNTWRAATVQIFHYLCKETSFSCMAALLYSAASEHAQRSVVCLQPPYTNRCLWCEGDEASASPTTGPLGRLCFILSSPPPASSVRRDGPTKCRSQLRLMKGQ